MFISNAYAADAAAAAPGLAGVFMQFAPMLAIGVLFWFMLIRPQQKQAKEHKAMLETLTKGDEVSCASGIVGKVVSTSEAHIVLEISEGVNITIVRGAVSKKLEKGTIKKIGQ